MVREKNRQLSPHFLLSLVNGTEDIFFNSADIKNINSTQQIKFKELTKRFYI